MLIRRVSTVVLTVFLLGACGLSFSGREIPVSGETAPQVEKELEVLVDGIRSRIVPAEQWTQIEPGGMIGDCSKDVERQYRSTPSWVSSTDQGVNFSSVSAVLDDTGLPWSLHGEPDDGSYIVGSIDDPSIHLVARDGKLSIRGYTGCLPVYDNQG